MILALGWPADGILPSLHRSLPSIWPKQLSFYRQDQEFIYLLCTCVCVFVCVCVCVCVCDPVVHSGVKVSRRIAVLALIYSWKSIFLRSE